MIDKLKDNLASVAALIAAVAAIGGGFVKYGEISTRLSQIEASQSQTVDVSGIGVNAEDDAKRFYVSENGIVLVTPEMLGQKMHQL